MKALMFFCLSFVLALLVALGSVASAQLTINPTGDIGIGTTAPVQKLHVDGGNEMLSTGPGSGFKFRDRGSTSADDWVWYSAGNIARFWRAGSGDLMGISPTGDIGIGTTSPGFKLDVAGPVHASSFPTSSDGRLKTNITQLTNVLEKLDKIRAVSFEWNELYKSLGRSTGKREIGIIAQEVEAVFPELVTTWGDKNYRAIDYSRLAGVLIEAVNELKTEKDTQIAALKAENATLQKQFRALEERLAALEQARVNSTSMQDVSSR